MQKPTKWKSYLLRYLEIKKPLKFYYIDNGNSYRIKYSTWHVVLIWTLNKLKKYISIKLFILTATPSVRPEIFIFSWKKYHAQKVNSIQSIGLVSGIRNQVCILEWCLNCLLMLHMLHMLRMQDQHAMFFFFCFVQSKNIQNLKCWNLKLNNT